MGESLIPRVECLRLGPERSMNPKHILFISYRVTTTVIISEMNVAPVLVNTAKSPIRFEGHPLKVLTCLRLPHCLWLSYFSIRRLWHKMETHFLPGVETWQGGCIMSHRQAWFVFWQTNICSRSNWIRAPLTAAQWTQAAQGSDYTAYRFWCQSDNMQKGISWTVSWRIVHTFCDLLQLRLLRKNIRNNIN